MGKTRVRFIKLERPERAHIICQIAEREYEAGERVLVRVADQNQGVTLDGFMWTWRKDSFLPHAFDNGAIDCIEEPVVIVAADRNGNASRIAILNNPSPTEWLKQFKTVYEFVEFYDEQLRAEARGRWNRYRDAGFDVAMEE